jgi:hypothetical protein
MAEKCNSPGDRCGSRGRRIDRRQRMCQNFLLGFESGGRRGAMPVRVSIELAQRR